MHVDNILPLPQQFREKGIEVTCTGGNRGGEAKRQKRNGGVNRKVRKSLEWRKGGCVGGVMFLIYCAIFVCPLQLLLSRLYAMPK